jgi:DNA repair protein RecN (Recombination protein N)
MPNAKLKVELRNNEGLNFYGSDRIEFLFDANKSGQFHPIRKVASGGELNRLMLCIKSLVAQSVDPADDDVRRDRYRHIRRSRQGQVGIIMKGLASKRQIICITHQPQIAGKADAHFFVYKDVVGDMVKTNLRQLTKEERITCYCQNVEWRKTNNCRYGKCAGDGDELTFNFSIRKSGKILIETKGNYHITRYPCFSHSCIQP